MRNPGTRPIRRLFLVAVTTLAIVVSCTGPFDLAALLDGPDGAPLAIAPDTAVLAPNQTVHLKVSGGHPPYDLVKTGVGALQDDVYYAGAGSGTAKIQVRDVVGSIAAAEFIVSTVDYVVSVAPSGGNRAGGTKMTEAFTIRNAGQDDGTATLSWTAHISTDPSFSADDPVVASGSIAGGLAAGESSLQTVTGTWPDSGVRYLIIRLDAFDDAYTANNIVSSAPYFVGDPLILDYVPMDLSMRYPIVTTSSPISETFAVVNVGGVSGTQPITWVAYASPLTMPNPAHEVGRGTLDPLPGGGAVSGITVTGLWPSTRGDYHLIVEVDAPDEAYPGDYVVSAGTFRVNKPPDYEFQAVTFESADYGGNPGELLTVSSSSHGGVAAHTFEIVEINGAPGQQSIQWSLDRSRGGLLDDGDTYLHGGVIAPLAAEGTSGTITLPSDLRLPATPGRYYYLLRLTAGDDGNPWNDTYAVGPVHVWSTSIANTSITTDWSTHDHFVQLNSGDQVVVTGQINETGFWDRFPIRAGAGVSELRMWVEWTAVQVNIDLRVHDGHYAHLAESVETGSGREPGTGTLDVAVNEFEHYAIDVDSVNATGGQVGQPYTLTIQAYPLP